MAQRLSVPRDCAERLRRIPVFAGLPDAAREQLARSVEWWRLTGGESIVTQGDPGDAVFFVLRGRALATTTHADGSTHVVGDLGPGQPIGELALVAGLPRTATVCARRDSEVVRLTKRGFDEFVRDHPDAALTILGIVAQRLERMLSGRALERASASTIAVLDVTDDGGAIADQLVAALRDRTPVERLTARADDDPEQHTTLIAAIDAQESAGGVTVLDVPPGPAPHGGLRQADVILVVCPAEHPGRAQDARRTVDELRATGGNPELRAVLVQPQHRRHPVETARTVAGYDAHHHVRAGSTGDFARIARDLLAAAVGLALGGGGARGMSHIGAYRALRDAEVPVDVVGGSSTGGVVALQVAAGWAPEEMQERNRAGFTRARIARSFTMPLLSLMSARRAATMLDEMFGGLELEDLWLPCFVTTVNLSTCRLAIQARGRASKWALATLSAPGLWPPVTGEDGAIHVDGAVLDNLPVMPLRDRGANHVVAVNVSRQPNFAVTAGASTPTVLEYGRALVMGEPGPRFPNLLQVLTRSALVTGLAGQATAREHSDVFVEPPVEPYSLTDYERTDELVPIGEAAMRAALAEASDRIAAWR